MFSDVFLAQTAMEMTEFPAEKTAYLSCHFSPYSRALSNLPNTLPPESLLLLDDSTPPIHHDPDTVASQLTELVDQFSPKAVLLDFQNPPTKEALKMAEILLQVLPCCVAVTKEYAKKLGCPVFLAPPPVNAALQEHLAPWKKQGVFLELAPEALEITVTGKGSARRSVPYTPSLPLYHARLLCHYRVAVHKNRAEFTLCRNREDLLALAHQARKLGVLGTVGLYQELKSI